MISFNVAALLVSVEPKLAEDTLTLLLNSDAKLSKYTELQSLLELTDLCLITYFQVYNKIYEQAKSKPMGLHRTYYQLQ